MVKYEISKDVCRCLITWLGTLITTEEDLKYNQRVPSGKIKSNFPGETSINDREKVMDMQT